MNIHKFPKTFETIKVANNAKSPSHNISDDERLALKNLSSNPNIVIPPVDIGNATVIQRSTCYFKVDLMVVIFYTPLATLNGK